LEQGDSLEIRQAKKGEKKGEKCSFHTGEDRNVLRGRTGGVEGGVEPAGGFG